ncbi:MAG: hypothetical protein EOO88_15930 [Pedobacter sp.]|nr:MAG: hypothetical protein EOO88_15930 [Pedobacter sp.]
MRDAVLTPKGKEQCRTLSAAFRHHKEVDIVFASPLRRTIQTAALSFGLSAMSIELPEHCKLPAYSFSYTKIADRRFSSYPLNIMLCKYYRESKCR